jgi:hypothetical protein
MCTYTAVETHSSKERTLLYIPGGTNPENLTSPPAVNFCVCVEMTSVKRYESSDNLGFIRPTCIRCGWSIAVK